MWEEKDSSWRAGDGRERMRGRKTGHMKAVKCHEEQTKMRLCRILGARQLGVHR